MYFDLTYRLREVIVLLNVKFQVSLHHEFFAEFNLTLLCLFGLSVDFLLSSHPQYGKVSVVHCVLKAESANVEFEGDLYYLNVWIHFRRKTIRSSAILSVVCSREHLIKGVGVHIV